MDELLRAWTDGEPDPVDETAHTPWAEPGWAAWNGSSPEVAFCEAAARLAAGRTVVETGAGQGYVTRRVAATADQVLAYESWPELRDAIRPHMPDGAELSVAPTPPGSAFRWAELVVLDSDRAHRPGELARWAELGAGLCLVHDTGNGHEPHHNHMRLRAQVLALGVDGLLLGNPRGSALLWKRPPGPDVLGAVRLPVLERIGGAT